MKTTKPQISTVVLAYNEARRIRDCLVSAQWTDEIIVVDGFSTDETAAVAREFTENVFLSDLLGPANPGGFSAQRNFGLERATGDWVFFLDADERFTPELACEVRSTLEKGVPANITAFCVRRREHFFGVHTPYTHGEGWLTRMIRRGAGFWNDLLVHEGVRTEGEIAPLAGMLLHYSKDSVSEYLTTQNTYTSLDAMQAGREGQPLAASPLSGMFKTFLNAYVYKKAYREGSFGLVMSILFAQYNFLCWAKRWEIEMKAGRLSSLEPKQRWLQVIARILSGIWRRLSPPKEGPNRTKTA